jgi:hypothetical protein
MHSLRKKWSRRVAQFSILDLPRVKFHLPEVVLRSGISTILWIGKIGVEKGLCKSGLFTSTLENAVDCFWTYEMHFGVRIESGSHEMQL